MGIACFNDEFVNLKQKYVHILANKRDDQYEYKDPILAVLDPDP